MSWDEDLKRGIKDHGGSASFRDLDDEECELCSASYHLKTDGTHIICSSCLEEIDDLADEEDEE